MLGSIDLYSGIGGGSCGLRQAGYRPVFACDTDPLARLVFANNFMADIKNGIEAAVSKDIPHPEIIFASPPNKDITPIFRLLNDMQPRAMILEFPFRIIDKEKIAKRRQFDMAGYKCWHEVLNANDFGLPQKRKMFYIVGFRKDVKTPFNAFPFPYPLDISRTLADIVDPNPDPKLLLNEEQIQIVKNRNARNRSLGTGFRTQIFLPEHAISSLPISYHKDYRGILFDSGQGPRRLSVLECKRIMGFPDDFKLPVSDTEAYRLLAQASCPPMVEAIAREIKVWEA